MARRGRPSERGRGDVAAVFTELYDDHAADLLGWFTSRTYSGEVSADLCAETFAVAIEQYHRFDPDRGDAGAWLWGIGRNLLRSFLRSGAVEHRARTRLAISTPTRHDDDLDMITARLDAQTYAEDVHAAIATLPPSVADAVRARVVEGKSYDAVAADCGCSVGAARVRVSRGLATLLDRLDHMSARVLS